MTLFRSLIRAAATSDLSGNRGEAALLTPAERLSRIIVFTNNYVAVTHSDASMFATIFIGILEPESGTLTYMNCGHESPLLMKKDGAVMPLLRTGPAVGVIAEADFAIEEITIKKNDFLLAFTDGIPDAINTDQAYFGKDRLLKIIESDAMAPESLLPKIEEELHQFIGTARQFDDITLLEIRNEG